MWGEGEGTSASQEAHVVQTSGDPFLLPHSMAASWVNGAPDTEDIHCKGEQQPRRTLTESRGEADRFPDLHIRRTRIGSRPNRHINHDSADFRLETTWCKATRSSPW